MDTDNDNRDAHLDARLNTLRSAMAGLDAPRGVEKELMTAFARRHAAKPWYQRVSARFWRMAGGLGSVAALAMVFMLSPQSPDRIGGDGAPLVGRDADGGVFIALDSLERIEREPNPRVIETQVPRTELASLGVAVTPENAGEAVHAEMLVGADGQPLALRLTSLQ